MALNSTFSTFLVRNARHAKIFGGIEALPGEFIHQVAITYDDDFICGGSIMSQILILTAAHCVLSSTCPHVSLLKVIAGLHNLTLGGVGEQVRDVKLVYTHEDYKSSTFENDIAILLLNEPLRYSSTIGNLSLPMKGEVFKGNATISGWGRTMFGGWGSLKLRKVVIPIIHRDDCQGRYKGSYNITDSMLCIGGTGADSCQGDSGGAAICMRNDSTKIDCGIVSFGLGCGKKEFPGVYTLVSAYTDWIEEAEKEIVLMECFVNYLTIDEFLAVSDESRIKQFKTISNTYSEIIEQYKNVLIPLNFDFEFNTKIEIDFLKENIHTLEKLSRLSHWETVDRKVKSVQECFTVTAQLRRENSVIRIDWLNDDTKLSRFIKIAYRKFGKSEVFDYLLSFIDELPTCQHAKVAVTAFAEVVNEEGDIESLENSRILKALRVCTADCELIETEMCDFAFKICREMIRNGTLQDIYDFAEAYPAAFRNRLEDIIKTSFATDIKNFQNVFQFLTNLPSKSEEVFSLHVLFNEMKELTGFGGPEILMLAYRQELLRYKMMEEMTLDMISKLDDITWSLPETTRSLVFDSWVYLQNQATNAILGTKTGDNRILSCELQNDFDPQWKVEVVEDGRYVMIMRINSNHALAYVNKTVQSVGFVKDIRIDNQFHWLVVPVQGNPELGISYIKNRSSGKILVEGENVGNNCRSIEAIDNYSNERKSLWIVW